MDETVEVAHQALFANMGQVCVAGSRTFVHNDIYDEFVKKSVERAKKRVIGNPFDSKTESGPQVKTGKYCFCLQYACSYDLHHAAIRVHRKKSIFFGFRLTRTSSKRFCL